MAGREQLGGGGKETCAHGKCDESGDMFLCCVSCKRAVGCVPCCVFCTIQHLQEVLGMRCRLSACLGSHWTARLGSKGQTQLSKKSATGLHRLSVGPWGI